MKIIVLAKEVPDTYGDRKLNLETGLTERGASEPVADEIGERALELALKISEGHEGAEVTVLSMGPETAEAAVRKGLAMGAHHGILISDEQLVGSDLGTTAEVLAAAIRRRDFDLVIAGNASTDGSAGVVPAMLSELLQVALVSGLDAVQFDGQEVSGIRLVEAGTQHVQATLPAVISITEALPEPRFPNFKGIMAAKKKPLEKLTAADLGVDPADLTSPRSIMLTVSERPPREAGVKIVDDGAAAGSLADFLLENRLA
jgi:electron transfer flavoprotein beta subunit